MAVVPQCVLGGWVVVGVGEVGRHGSILAATG